MAAKALANDADVLCFAVRMQFIADVATASLAAKLIYVVRGARKRPLVGIDLPATDITYLRLRQAHLLFSAGGMLLLGKVILAEALATIGAMPQRLFVAFVASSGGSDEVVTAFLLSPRFSVYISHWMMSLYIVRSDLL